MSNILSIEDSVRARIHECTEAVGHKCRTAVRPVYASKEGGLPELVGSSILLKVSDKKFVITAAHVVDWISSHNLYVAGVVGTEPIQMAGKIISTVQPAAGRNFDKVDCAFWEVSPEEEQRLGGVTFIDAAAVSHNRISLANRMYMAVGYPLSRNRGKIDEAKRSIKTVMWKYSSEAAEIPALAADLKISGQHHIFLRYDKYSKNADGKKVSSVEPRGISGGALVDLGNFASPFSLAPDVECTGRLAGMIIEKNVKHHALVALKIERVLEAIRSHNAL